jgi:hypothetical protein
MGDPADKTLYRTAAVIFEELGFLLPTPADNPIGSEPAAGAIIRFKGAFGGTLVVRITREVLPVLSANMLGDDAPRDESMQRDAIGEIANVICGNVLPALAGEAAVFNLESPSFFDGAAPADGLPDGRPSAEVHIGLDPGQADVSLYLPA